MYSLRKVLPRTVTTALFRTTVVRPVATRRYLSANPIADFTNDGDTTSLEEEPQKRMPSVTGYVGRTLNAKVYDAAVETPLQEAQNLSAVRGSVHRVLRPVWRDIVSLHSFL